jgi:ABC-type spermidine/putrescine transport system permease subunit I
MVLGISLVVIIVIASFVFTLLLGGKSDEGYSSDTKRNTTNLSAIYIVVILLSFIAVAVYIKWFA